MLSLEIDGEEFTLPRKNVVMFALHEALVRGVKRGSIHDEQTAIEYLERIGFEINELTENLE